MLDNGKHKGKEYRLGGRTQTGRRTKYPFTSLEVGDWFVVPLAKQTCNLRTFRGLTYKTSKRLGIVVNCHLLFNGDWEVVREY